MDKTRLKLSCLYSYTVILKNKIKIWLVVFALHYLAEEKVTVNCAFIKRTEGWKWDERGLLKQVLPARETKWPRATEKAEPFCFFAQF